jgi:hypothetical protein
MIFGKPIRWWLLLWLALFVGGFVVSFLPGGRFLSGLLFLVEIPVVLLLFLYMLRWLLPYTIRAWFDGGSS